MYDENGLETELVNCDNCGSTVWENLISSVDINYGVPGRFTLVKCNHCQLVYLNPMPLVDSIGLAYPNNYEPHSSKENYLENTTKKLSKKGLLKRKIADYYYFQNHDKFNFLNYALIYPFYLFAQITGTVLMPTEKENRNKVLDIGCGIGNFLNEMNNLGWDVCGIEPDQNAATIANERLSGRIINGYFKPGIYAEKTFDLITMWHVIEHLPSPSFALREVEKLLKPGGWLIIMAPNIRSFEYLIFRQYYYQLDLPRHLYHFSPKTLKKIIKKSGLCPSRILHGIEPRTWIFSLRNLLRTWKDHDIKLNKPGLYYLAFICSIISVLLRSASTITIYAQKPID